MSNAHTGNVVPETTREEHQGNLNAKRVIVVDASGNQITSFGGGTGGTQYADGAARGTATGTLGMVDDGTNVQSQAGDTDGNAKIVGNVASGSADSGNPIKAGAKYLTSGSTPIFTDGQRADLQVGSRGALRVQVMGADSTSAIAMPTAGADAESNTSNGLRVYNRNAIFNGSTWDRQPGDTTGTYTVGNVASGATDAGNPVKAAGRFNSTYPTFTDGQRGDLQLGSRGSLRVQLEIPNNNNNLAVKNSSSDGQGTDATTNHLGIASRGFVFNGTTWDRMRGDTNGTLVEQRYSYSYKTADGQVKASAGFLHSIIITPITATPTAGLLTIYDSTTESGTVIFSKWVEATITGCAYLLDVIATTGIYVGYDATLANVSCMVSYR